MSSDVSSVNFKSQRVAVQRKKKMISFLFRKFKRKQKTKPACDTTCETSRSHPIHSDPKKMPEFLEYPQPTREDVDKWKGNDETSSYDVTCTAHQNSCYPNGLSESTVTTGGWVISDTSQEERENIQNEATYQDLMMTTESNLGSSLSEASENDTFPIQESQTNNNKFNKGFAILVVTVLVFNFIPKAAVVCLILLGMFKFIETRYSSRDQQTSGHMTSQSLSKLMELLVLPFILFLKCLFEIFPKALNKTRRPIKPPTTAPLGLFEGLVMCLFPPLLFLRLLGSRGRQTVKPPPNRWPPTSPHFRRAFYSNRPGRGCYLCRKLRR